MGKAEILAATEKPQTVEPNLDNVPVDLRGEIRFIRWEWTWREKERKWAKVPLCYLTGEWISVNDTSKWGTLPDVAESVHGDGIGVVLGDGIIGIDLDNCIDPITRKLNDFAQEVVGNVPGYWEYSPTGTGVKGLFRGQLPENFTTTKNKDKTIEIYQSGRFFVITGDKLECASDWLEDRTAELIAVYLEYIGTPEQPQEQPATASVGTGTIKTAVEACHRIKPRDNENDGSNRGLLWAGRIKGQGLQGADAIPAA